MKWFETLVFIDQASDDVIRTVLSMLGRSVEGTQKQVRFRLTRYASSKEHGGEVVPEDVLNILGAKQPKTTPARKSRPKGSATRTLVWVNEVPVKEEEIPPQNFKTAGGISTEIEEEPPTPPPSPTEIPKVPEKPDNIKPDAGNKRPDNGQQRETAPPPPPPNRGNHPDYDDDRDDNRQRHPLIRINNRSNSGGLGNLGLGLIALAIVAVVIAGLIAFLAWNDNQKGRNAVVNNNVAGLAPRQNGSSNGTIPAKPAVNATQSASSGTSTTNPASPSIKTDGSMPNFVAAISHGAWNIQGTDRLKDNPVVSGWLNRLKDPDPANWKTFPNIPNPDVSAFRVANGTQVPDGMEYGTYSSPYCFSHPCDIPVGAWEYRYISGDYQFLGTSCKGDMKKGCMLVLINVMDQSYTWRNQNVDNGFTLRGRYFNGDALEWGVWGLVSHGSANMLNMPTFAHPGEVLNAGAPGNSGANCGSPNGCGAVDVTVVVHAGDSIIAVARTTVTKSGSTPTN